MFVCIIFALHMFLPSIKLKSYPTREEAAAASHKKKMLGECLCVAFANNDTHHQKKSYTYEWEICEIEQTLKNTIFFDASISQILTIERTSNQFSSQANSSIVLTIWIYANLLCYNDWLQFALHFTISVDVAS